MKYICNYIYYTERILLKQWRKLDAYQKSSNGGFSFIYFHPHQMLGSCEDILGQT